MADIVTFLLAPVLDPLRPYFLYVRYRFYKIVGDLRAPMLLAKQQRRRAIARPESSER
jgi:hypothetical protein